MTTITAYAEKLTDAELVRNHPVPAFRKGSDAEVPFMFKRSLADLRYADLFRQVPHTLFYNYTHKLLEWHFIRGEVILAYAENDPSHIMGFLVYYPDTEVGTVVIYAYVRKDNQFNHRGQGLLSKMVKEAQRKTEDSRIVYTLRTAIFRFSQGFRDRVDNDAEIEHNPFLNFTILPTTGWESKKPYRG
jgi:hypothetical protein